MSAESKFIVVVTTVVLLLMILTLVVVYSLFINKKSKLLISHQEKEKEFEKQHAESLNEMKEQTMKHIGLELHDNVGQKLSVVRLRSNQLSTKLDGEVKKELEEISDILKECISDVRSLSKSLNINMLNGFSLNDFLFMEFQRLKKIENVNFIVENTLNGHPMHINDKHGLIIYRMIQESLNNTYKHSDAKNIKVYINEKPHYYEFQIADDGKGFDPHINYSGKGLQNLRERAAMINALYEIHSEPDKGTKTIIKYHKK